MTDELKKRGRPRKTDTRASGPGVAVDTPALDAPAPLEERRRKQVSVIERRLKGKHLFAAPSQPIPLKDPKMTPRWFNSEISADRFFVAENIKGWTKVHVSDVASLDAVSGFNRTPEGWIVRGPRGQEMLYMMPQVQYDRIQAAKAAANIASMASEKKRRTMQAEAAAAKYGSQAGDYIHGVKTTIEQWRAPEEL